MFVQGDDTLSTVLGGISIGCWIVVYSPQILENYQLKSGEGLSVMFVLVWLLGDLCNMIGAILGGLLPTVIILALYYTICDIILLFQIYYYRWAWKRRPEQGSNGVMEESPLLDENANRDNVEHTRRRLYNLFGQYSVAILFVFATGLISWWISTRPHHNDKVPQKPPALQVSEWTIQVFGWTSAVLYLGARVPQIVKNFTTKCEGLSPGLFLFAISGNLTYTLSICVVSMEREYLIRNGGWLAGSALTIFFDIFVLCQFIFYRSRAPQSCGRFIATS